MNNKPIGIFDSGIGGLTVTHEIIRTLPHENLIYLGDTARVPYGSRDKDIITQFSLELTRFLLKEDPKAIVVACNTISATCLEAIQAISPVPVIGVVEPTIKEAISTTKTSHIGVIGTRATIASKIYEEKIRSLHHDIQITTKACPLFVPLAEEGWFDHAASKLIADEYLKELRETTIGTLILGCTHYPLLKNIIQEAVGDDIKLIDSARPTAEALKQLLKDNNLLRTEGEPEYKFFVTDSPTISERTARVFFHGAFPGRLEKVTLA